LKDAGWGLPRSLRQCVLQRHEGEFTAKVQLTPAASAEKVGWVERSETQQLTMFLLWLGFAKDAQPNPQILLWWRDAPAGIWGEGTTSGAGGTGSAGANRWDLTPRGLGI